MGSRKIGGLMSWKNLLISINRWMITGATDSLGNSHFCPFCSENYRCRHVVAPVKPHDLVWLSKLSLWPQTWHARNRRENMQQVPPLGEILWLDVPVPDARNFYRDQICSPKLRNRPSKQEYMSIRVCILRSYMQYIYPLLYTYRLIGSRL